MENLTNWQPKIEFKAVWGRGLGLLGSNNVEIMMWLWSETLDSKKIEKYSYFD